jgi:hypothetical protein
LPFTILDEDGAGWYCSNSLRLLLGNYIFRISNKTPTVLTGHLCFSLIFPQKNPRTTHVLGRNRFLPYRFQFIVNQWSNHSTPLQ